MIFVINYWAVLVAALVAFFISWAWFSPLLFVEPWMKSMGKSMDPNMKPSMADMWQPMLASLVQQLVTAYILAHVAIAFGAVGWMAAIQLGVWVWLGFVATTLLSQVLWEKRPRVWYAITAGHYLVSLIVMSLILVLWY